jgi:DNA-binding winged helix-turn-helix (wHTH) protein/Tfp pilus assembly protein PilF
MQTVQDTVFRLGRATLDRGRGTLHVDGTLVPVRHKTFRLLEFLAAHAGRVVGKDEILDAIWPDVVFTEDSLTQCIRDARRAIGDEEQAIIRTVPRRGYLLVADVEEPVADPFRDHADDPVPRIAVLPFRVEAALGPELSGQVLAEDAVTAIACFQTVAVVAWPLSEGAGGAPAADLLQVARRSGADYCVEAAIRRTDQLEVTLSLTDVAAGRRTWARRFAVPLDNLSDLPGTVASLVASHVVATVEHAVAGRPPVQSAAQGQAYAHLIRGRVLLRSYGPGVNEAARAEFEAAVALDPGSGLAVAYRALSDVVIAGYQLAPRAVLERCRDEAERAVRLAPLDARCQRIFSTILTFLRAFAAADEAFRRALELNPYDPDTLAHVGFCCAMRGRCEEALRWLDRATRLNPLHPDWYHLHRHISLYLLGRYREAADALEKIPRRTPWQNVRLAAAYAMDDREDDAVRALEDALAEVPDFDLEAFAFGMNLERADDREHYLRGMRLAAEARARSGAR